MLHDFVAFNRQWYSSHLWCVEEWSWITFIRSTVKCTQVELFKRTSKHAHIRICINVLITATLLFATCCCCRCRFCIFFKTKLWLTFSHMISFLTLSLLRFLDCFAQSSQAIEWIEIIHQLARWSCHTSITSLVFALFNETSKGKVS